MYNSPVYAVDGFYGIVNLLLKLQAIGCVTHQITLPTMLLSSKQPYVPPHWIPLATIDLKQTYIEITKHGDERDIH